MIKKTYIPSKPRNPKLSATTGTSGAVGKTEFNQFAGSSHEHHNKGVLDQITEAMLVGALRDLITSTDTESELTDENILSSLRVLSEITKNNDTLLEDIKAKFLSKIEPDTAQKLITFVEGIEIGDYTTGFLGGGGAFKMINGISHLEVDKLDVRMIATFFELVISKLRHIGGQFILTPASMKCIEVEVVANGYKCFFDRGDNNEVAQEFVVNDQARCQVFSGSGLKMYWRLVVEVGDDYIVLSDTDKLEGSSIPEVGDDIVQLGYRGIDKPERTSAMVLSTVGIDAPSFKQYKGIVSYTLEGKETTALTGTGNRLAGDTIFIQDKSLDTVLDEIEQANRAPKIVDGYWWEWNPDSTEEDKYEDTGVKAEGIKGDGVQQKFLSADEKPEKPTGDAVGWNDIPDEEEAPDVPLEPIGANLYSKSYMLAQGWIDRGNYIDKTASSIPTDDHLTQPSNFKPLTQYRYVPTSTQSGSSGHIEVLYSDSTTKNFGVNQQFDTDKGKTVVSIKLKTTSTGSGVTQWVGDGTTIQELRKPTVQAKPIWTIFRNITNGVASEWSEPVKWLGEGTPGKDGKDGSDGVGLPGNDGNDGVTPHVGANGNWYIGSQDTGVPARGPAGSGRGIISIREQFYIHTSGTIPPGTTWTWLDSMPKKTEADEGKFLWIRIKTIFTDDSTPDYSSPRVYEEWGIKDYVEKSAYLLEALREHPKVTTGLLLSKVIGMFDINGDVTSYMNGNPTLNPNAFASGVENFGQQGVETAKAVIRHDGSAKFTDADITGTVNATGGDIGGLSLEGKKLFSQNHKLQIDGEEATIALLDPNTDALRTIIRPTNITTSVASYFASSSISPASIATIKANYTKTIWNLASSSMTLNATGGKTFEVNIPAFSVTMGVTHPGGAGISSVYARMAVYLTNGSSMKQPLTSLASIVTSTGGTFSKPDSYPAQKVVVTNSGKYYLRVELTHSPEAVSPNGQFSSTATNFTASEVVNRSEIGSNGMVIATSDTNYSFMVGNTFEVRRGSYGLQITNSGIKKWNGSSWVTANI